MEDIESKNEVESKGSKQSKLSEDLRISQQSLNYKPPVDGEEEEESLLKSEVKDRNSIESKNMFEKKRNSQKG